MRNIDRMSPEEREKELLELTRENNKILRKMRRDAVIGFIFKIIFWAIVIGVPIALYYYVLGPYIDQLQNVYGNVQSDVNELSSFKDQITDFLGKFDFSSTTE